MLWLLACDTVLFNNPPSVRLRSPEAEAVYALGQPVRVEVEVRDDRDGPGEILLVWLVDGAPVAGPRRAATDGTARLSLSDLPVGRREITVRAIDGDGESDRSSATVQIFDNQPPTLTLSAPLDGQRFLAGSPVDVRFAATDPDPIEGQAALRLVWGGVATGVDGAPTELEASGEGSFSLEGLGVGDWRVTGTAEDDFGAKGSAEAAFAVVDGDEDGDGYLSTEWGGDDCDDADRSVHPGAVERCNGVDDDCDGAVDEEARDGLVFYADADGDGYGDPAIAEVRCESGAGWVDDDTDCDDTDAAVNPAATELCGNNIDDDCDGEVDSDAPDTVTAWADADGDGWGAGEPYSVCALGPGEAAVDGDCNDGDPAVNPGAIEVCDELDTDEDCNGLADDDDPGATGKTSWYADADGDGHGDPASVVWLCDAASGGSLSADDCNDADPLAWTGAVEVCEDGSDNDCIGGDARCAPEGATSIALADHKLTGESGLDFAGSAVAGVGDLDGDGLDDFIVSAWAAGGNGAVYVVSSSTLASGSLGGWPSVGGEAYADVFGWSVAACGDLDGDGLGDWAAAAPDAASGDGALYLFAGGGRYASATDGVAVYGMEDGEGVGESLSCGMDVDGDGAADLLAGAPGIGAARLYDAATMALSATFTAQDPAGGAAAALVNDTDGDGLADLLIGEDSADRAYLVLGAGGLGDTQLVDADAIWTGEASGDGAGWAVAGLGDINGDGLGDLAVGAPYNAAAGIDGGAVYVILGGSPSSGALSAADAVIVADSGDDLFGWTLAAAGDVDADGVADFLAGAPTDDTGGGDGGAAFLFYGGAGFAATSVADAGASFYAESSGDDLGWGLGAAGDLDGDGAGDLLIGASSEDYATGAVYVVFGGAG